MNREREKGLHVPTYWGHISYTDKESATGSNRKSMMGKARQLSKLFGGLWVVDIILISASCVTQPTGIVYQYRLPSSSPNTRFVDGNVVYTSVGDSSAVELRLQERRLRGFNWLEVAAYVENLGDNTFDVAQSDFLVVRIQEQTFNRERLFSDPNVDPLQQGSRYFRTQFYTIQIFRAVEPDRYAAAVAEHTPDGVGSARGGLGTYLSGGTIGEAIIAQNQASAAAAARGQSRRNQVTTTRRELIARTTLRPGEAITGGVGFAPFVRVHVSDGPYETRTDVSRRVPEEDSISEDTTIKVYESEFGLRGRELSLGSPERNAVVDLVETVINGLSDFSERHMRTVEQIGRLPNNTVNWGVSMSGHSNSASIYKLEHLDNRVHAYVVVTSGSDVHVAQILDIRRP